jgi:ligand-binding SRPBCC domain-containing protein
MRSVTRSVALAAPAGRVWEHATRIEGVNAELRPILRMTVPRHLRGATIGDLEAGVPAGRSWLLLGGVLPVDYDDLCIAELDPQRRFLERSRMASMSLWQHERTVAPRGEGSSVLTDTLTFRLRGPLAAIPGMEALSARIVGALFSHRHRRLVAMHGAAQAR